MMCSPPTRSATRTPSYSAISACWICRSRPTSSRPTASRCCRSPSVDDEAHQYAGMAGQGGGRVGGLGEAGPFEVLADAGVGHRQVDLAVAVVEGIGLDDRGVVRTGEVDGAGDQG